MSKWTPQLALRRMRCRIEDAKAALADVALIWSDIDDFIAVRADERIQDLDAFMAEVQEAVRERQEAGEEYSL
jgi:hypothetical protein